MCVCLPIVITNPSQLHFNSLGVSTEHDMTTYTSVLYHVRSEHTHHYRLQRWRRKSTTRNMRITSPSTIPQKEINDSHFESERSREVLGNGKVTAECFLNSLMMMLRCLLSICDSKKLAIQSLCQLLIRVSVSASTQQNSRSLPFITRPSLRVKCDDVCQCTSAHPHEIVQGLWGANVCVPWESWLVPLRSDVIAETADDLP